MVAGIGALLAPLFSFYNTVFQPMLLLGPYISLLFFSAVLAGLFSVIYWFFLDIERADEIKEKLNKYQDKMKEARENDKNDKASEHLKKTLQLNQKFMMLNMKPMIVTMIFVGLFFPWLGSVYAPNVQMDSVSNSTWEGNLTYAGQQQLITTENTSEGIIVSSPQSEAGIKGQIPAFGINWQVADFRIVESAEHDAVLKFNAAFIDLPFSIPLAGTALNWLGFYILIVMPLTYGFRKALGVQ
jgi:uncharacterized membrane protein (DUF106 family)